jgi:FkbM family methyltransferase
MIRKLILALKLTFRDLYYRVYNNAVVPIEGVPVLASYKWIMGPISSRAYYKGYYEPALTALILKSLPKDGVFFDIGSHAGYFGLLGAAKMPAGQVFSFEPVPENYQFSQRIRDLNKVSQWTIEGAAIGDSRGVLRFQTGRMTTMGKFSDQGDLEVPVETIDDYVREHGINRVDFIKIDVEGFAIGVFRGAVQTIAQFKPQIFCEIHNLDEREAVQQALGPYTFFDINEKPVTDVFDPSLSAIFAVPIQRL